MFNDSKEKFSYESDVRWLVEQARPYYYSIIFILIILGFYNIALFYSLAAISLVWDVDEVDRIDDDERRREKEIKDPTYVQRVVNLEILVDYLESVSLESQNFDDFEYFHQYLNILDSNLGFYLNDYYLYQYENKCNNNNNDNIIIDYAFDFKNKIIKFDEENISKAILIRSKKDYLIKERLFQMKKKCRSVKDPHKRIVLKARMKKLMELSSDLEYELLQYKISIDLII